MPAAIDLRGKRFGALVARRREPDGRWLCDCDCGRETIVKVNRLSIKDSDRRAIRACETCRSRRCVICGCLYLKSGSAATCGGKYCRTEHRRATNKEIVDRVEFMDPGRRHRQQLAYREKVKSDPVRKAAQNERDASAARKRRKNFSAKQRAIVLDYQRSYYAENRERIRAYYKSWSSSTDRIHKIRDQARRADQRRRARKALARLSTNFGVVVENLNKDTSNE